MKEEDLHEGDKEEENLLEKKEEKNPEIIQKGDGLCVQKFKYEI